MLASANTNLNYNTHAYLAILLTQSSPLLLDPSTIHPDLKHIGPVCLRHSSQLDPLTAIQGRSTARRSCILNPETNVGLLLRGNH
jgi:hypothetical protein